MGIISRMRKQTAVYWAPKEHDDYGETAYEAPVQIDCRWDDSAEQFVDANGKEAVSRAVVYPDRHCIEDGILVEGALADIENADEPKKNSGYGVIRRAAKTPNLRNTETLYTAYLGR